MINNNHNIPKMDVIILRIEITYAMCFISSTEAKQQKNVTDHFIDSKHRSRKTSCHFII